MIRPEKNSPSLSFIIPVMGRLEHVKQALESVLRQPDCEVILVDYSCPDHTGDWAEKTFGEKYKNLRVIRYPNQEFFNLCKARNIGAASAKKEFVCFLDCDMILEKAFTDSCLPALDGDSYIVFEDGKLGGYSGMIIIEKSSFDELGGYNEELKGWGYEDVDLRERAKQKLLKFSVGNTLAKHITHDDEERVKFYEEKNKNVSMSENKIISCQRKNPSEIEMKFDIRGHLGDQLCFLSALRMYKRKHPDKEILIREGPVSKIGLLFDPPIPSTDLGEFAVTSGSDVCRSSSEDVNFFGAFLNQLGIGFTGKPALDLPFVEPLLELQREKYIAFQPYSIFARNPNQNFINEILQIAKKEFNLPIVCVGKKNTSRHFKGVCYDFLSDSPLQLLRVIAHSRLVLSPRSASAHVAAAYHVPSIIWFPNDTREWHLDYPNWKKILYNFDTTTGFSPVLDFFKSNMESRPTLTTMNVRKIYAVRKIRTQNIGDLNCSPFQYFDPHVPVCHVDLDDVHTLFPSQNDLVVLGGGGIFFPRWKQELENLSCRSANLVVWGAGLNTHGQVVDSYPDWVFRCKFFGVRDKIHRMNWVPCPSCMHPCLDEKYDVKHEKVVYQHLNYPIPLSLPKMTNNTKSVEEVIAFLGSAKVVVTNSYHGAYWAGLLGRKVELWKPWSTKFYFMAKNNKESSRQANNCFASDISTFLVHGLSQR